VCYLPRVCGRYTDDAEFSDIRVRFEISGAELFRPWQPVYNISPTYGPGFEQLLVRSDGQRRSVHLGRWWMIPAFWSKPLKSLPTSFNARAEEVATKPFYRDAFTKSRCLVPATGWREFTGAAGHKQPFHFHLERRLFAFAGVSSTWRAPDGQGVESFAILTTTPTPAAAAIHDRMPLVLSEEHERAWLDPAADPAEVLARACARAQSFDFEIYASNAIGNNGRFEGPEVLEPALLRASREPAKEPPNPSPKQGRLF
jgi:putative SOS response-associated peptidase YedK